MRFCDKKALWNIILGVLLALTLCFIWGNSLLSREDSSELSGGLLAWLTPLFRALRLEAVDEHVLRKLAHFGEFALLGLELAGLFFLNRGRAFKSACLSALCALAAASADETIQLFSGRAAMLKDVLLDFAGALTGILLLWFLTARRNKNRAQTIQKDGLCAIKKI